MPGFAQDRTTAFAGPELGRLRQIDSWSAPLLLRITRLHEGQACKPHAHARGQFLFPRSGRCRIWTEGEIWTASPRQAIWIPSGVLHYVEGIAATEVHNAYVDAGICRDMPGRAKVMTVSPLLAELIAYALGRGAEALPVGADARVHQVIADQIRSARDVAAMHLPLSGDSRLGPLLDRMVRHPEDGRSLEQWADAAHMSARTLARLFLRETGLSFGQWRQRLRIMEAMARLAEGQSVLAVSLDLGYASQSAFTAMFRKVTGTTPSDFLRDSAAPTGRGRRPGS
ncbi:helix-turn-helix domain-containing protein [Paracoccus versutus]|uniref:helix-turn-helix domain-containing protein n=1 Tax=Paracoccus versutus TaxID=34007 RepID=UPI000DF84BF1|nr:helix-turn-helix transcriptional regulator [Paracoccus versutus]RDD70399.1 AraC family transcriptional regulator [Paracoccus versutus]